jgi:hypothetical protein
MIAKAMKKVILLCILALGFAHMNLLPAQCSGGTSAGAVTPTLVFQTVAITAGTYRTFAATAGNTYIFSFCQGGGSAAFDNQLTILTNAGVFAGAYSDDVCGSAAEVSWTCTTTGTYRVLMNQYFCTASASSATMAYRMFVPGPGATCANPHVVPSLPFTANGLTTCGAGNDYTSADACASFYMGGEDYVFRYVATGAQDIQIALSGTLSYTGVFVTQGCPAGGVCIAANSGVLSGCTGGGGTPNLSSTGNPVATFSLPGAGTYYFIVDTWPSPTCTGFDINVTAVTSGPVLPGCTNYAISTPAYSPDNFNSGTLLTFPDDFFSPVIPLPFSFCFMGTNYNSLVVSSNAYVTFNTACAGQASSWDTDVIPAPAISNSPEARNSIMFPWTDVDPSVGGTIRYNTYGTTPNRRFVVSFRNVPMYDIACNSLLYTGQVVIYETSFVIDIYIQNLPNCPSWNGGEAVLGLFDNTGTAAVPVPGYNNTVYTLSNFARRFTPTCPTCTTPLPVDFATLSGSHDKGVNHLSWRTNYEINSSRFVLERSLDGLHFEQVGSLEGAGTEPQGRAYSMDDMQPYSPSTYYRVVQSDYDGAETASEVIVISSTANGFGVMQVAFVEGTLEMDVFNESGSQSVKIEVVDLLGKVVHTVQLEAAQGSSKLQVPLSGLGKGAYLVRATTLSGSQSTRKFVVSR